MFTFAQAQEILTRVWGYTAFRPDQLKVLDLIMTGKDVLGVLSTGSGKSLLYQIPALLTPGTALVVSPLIALMKDQVDDLTRRRRGGVVCQLPCGRGRGGGSAG